MINVYTASLVLFRLDKVGASKSSVEAKGFVTLCESQIWRGKQMTTMG
jgi:hypothetical protein